MALASSIKRSSLPSMVHLHCEANQRTLCGDAGRGGLPLDRFLRYMRRRYAGEARAWSAGVA